jgi:hypothetical protein
MNDEFEKSLESDTPPISVPDKINQYAKLIEVKKQIEERYDALRKDLLEEMKRTKVVSLKTETYTLTRQTRKTIKVTNDRAAITALKDLGHEVITKEVIDMEYMKPVITGLTEQGEVLAGVEEFNTEFVSIRSAGKKK